MGRKLLFSQRPAWNKGARFGPGGQVKSSAIVNNSHGPEYFEVVAISVW